MASLTKQHFEVIADLIANGREHFKSNTAHAKFAAEAADELARWNPNFDRQRFIHAAMPGVWVGTKHETAWEREASR